MKTTPYLIFDFDSTIIKLEALEEIADCALEEINNKDEILKEISEITTLGMEGKIDFKESLLKRMSLFRINKKHIEMANKKILKNISNSFLKNIDFIKKNSEKIYIISGGFDHSIFPIAKHLEINPSHIIANQFIFDSANNVTGVNENSLLLRPSGKSLAISDLNLEGEIIVIGDGYTDYQIKENGACHKFIAFCENVRREKIIQKADFIANNLDDIINFIYK